MCSHVNMSIFIAPSVIVEDDDGFLHSEVGIDKDLERLLAEDPGLYMEDVSNGTNRTNNNTSNYNAERPPVSSILSSSSNPTRCELH